MDIEQQIQHYPVVNSYGIPVHIHLCIAVSVLLSIYIVRDPLSKLSRLITYVDVLLGLDLLLC